MPSQAHNPRRWATTDSWDIPSPTIVPTAEIAYGLQHIVDPSTGKFYRTYNLSFLDLFRGKMAAHDLKYTGTAPSLTTINARLTSMLHQQLISYDLLRGLRMDINRAFGNATDDNGNFVVDDPDEFQANFERMWQGSALQNQSGILFDANNDGMVLYDRSNAQADNFARQQFARQLYVLLMLFKDTGYRHPQTTNTIQYQGNPIEGDLQDPVNPTVGQIGPLQALTATRIAQFAVNVVDFRDRDGIMTPFEYDMDPFNNTPINSPAYGTVYWRVDGVLGYNSVTGALSVDDTANYRGLVWGCEAQELLLTEAVAFHDKRLRDTKYDTGPAPVAEGMPNTYFPMRINTNPKPMTPPTLGHIDPDLDQVRQPQGSAFFELYACGNGNTWGAWSGDLYLPPRQRRKGPDHRGWQSASAIGQSAAVATISAR